MSLVASSVPSNLSHLSPTLSDPSWSTQFDMVKNTRRLLRIFAIEAAQKGIKLVINIGPSFEALGHFVEADSVRLNQITM